MFAYMNNRFASKKAHMLAQRLFMRNLKRSYLEHINLSLDRIRDTIMVKSGGVTESLNALLNLFAELSVMLLLYGVLVYTNWKMTFVLTFILALQVFFITKYMSRFIQNKGSIVNDSNAKSLKILSKFFGNFKFTKLKDNHEEAYQAFSQNSLNNAKAITTYNTLQAIPNRF
ncbi:hypothetical protein NHP190012_05360 [Helicobacter sp. NHP19-012]|uniref:ABC transmembrane type-1 domain-containing protein n=1 Tax=Helicobacter gastrofelis TaxID=2849642 RepID=A0ABM7SDW3_9HELI|nr:hypothetical protein NHP190012_05360 [Helicobacter sp. NHP19-012]